MCSGPVASGDAGSAGVVAIPAGIDVGGTVSLCLGDFEAGPCDRGVELK